MREENPGSSSLCHQDLELSELRVSPSLFHFQIGASIRSCRTRLAFSASCSFVWLLWLQHQSWVRVGRDDAGVQFSEYEWMDTSLGSIERRIWKTFKCSDHWKPRTVFFEGAAYFFVSVLFLVPDSRL